MRMIRLASRIRHAVIDTQHTADMLLACLAIATGIWLLVPGWAVERYPRVSVQMAVVWPICVWGALFAANGACAACGIIAHRIGAVVFSHLFGFGLWLFLGGILTFRSVPLPEGFLCAVIGIFCGIRLAQIPD